MQRSQMPTPDDNWKKQSRSKRKKKTLRLEYRVRPEKARISPLFRGWEHWVNYHAKYRTKEQRKMAMDSMNRKDTLFEYRIPLGEKE